MKCISASDVRPVTARTSVRCIVLAQGLGCRGHAGFLPAQLHLLGRTLSELKAAGIDRVTVVDGDEPEQLRAQINVPMSMQVDVRGYSNWRKSSASVTCQLLRDSQQDATVESILVVRGNRPPGEQALRDLLAVDVLAPNGARAALMVVKNETPLVGEHSVEEWKVGFAEGGRMTALGMDIESYNGLSAGHFHLHASVLAKAPKDANVSIEDVLTGLCEDVVVVPAKREWPLVPQPVRVEDEVEELLQTRGRRKYTLLNPGPVNTTPRVKSAMVHQDLCHRDKGFSELMASLSQQLRRIFRGGIDHTICVLTGSGTAAMESAITAVAPPEAKLLIIDNGAFGERMVEVAKVHNIDVIHLQYPWGQPVDMADVKGALEQHPDIATVSMVHHETSVGLLNAVQEVGRIAHEHGALFVVDAVSSLGAEDLDVVRDNIDVCFSSANKCLHAISGVGFVCVAPHVWERIAHIAPRSFYLDLRRYRDYASELAQTPFTPAVSSFFALEAACREFLVDGHAARFATYEKRNLRLREGLGLLGMPSFTNTGRESHSLVTCKLPQGVQFAEFYDGLRAKGYIVYACKGPLADSHFQVANMGDITQAAIDEFLACAAAVLRSLRSLSAMPNRRSSEACSVNEHHMMRKIVTSVKKSSQV